MTTTPHHVGQITKAEILVAHLLDTAPDDANPQRIATVVVQQLQDAGWTPPRDPTEAPPAAGSHSTLEGRARARQLLADALATLPRDTP